MLAGLHHVIDKRIGHFFEPMRDTRGNNDDIALGDLMSLTTWDFFAPDFSRCYGLGVDSSTTRHKSGGSLKHVDNVSVPGVDLSHAGLFATAGVDHVFVTGVEQNRTLLKCRLHFLAIEICHWSGNLTQ